MHNFINELTVNNWNYKGYIVRQQLIDTRGWTPELIDQFLIPDLIEPNPHNNNQRMRLYLQDNVFKVEASTPFKTAILEKYKNRISVKNFLHFKNSIRQTEKNKKQKWHNARRRLASKPEVDYNIELERLGLA